MTYYTTDPGAKGRFIRALRDLADYLDRHPAIPVPEHGRDRHRARQPRRRRRTRPGRPHRPPAGAGVRDETARGGHYWAARPFGPIGYEIAAISDRPPWPATDAPISYHGSVTPDTWT